ncbi:MAG: dihydrolipoyl dehydrogenase [Actinomycetia bacterium]|nr:dihydrolipoyl dehydrogenase [Actinomycetes bacterium]
MRIAILGGGPGGYSAAFEASRLGAEVVLVEHERLGGTCLNRGCVPTKAILRSAQVAADARQASELGLVATTPSVDLPALRTRKESIVDELVSQLEDAARRSKVHLVTGDGRLRDARSIEVTLATGGTEIIHADAIILATGSVVLQLPGIDHDLEGVWTSDDAVSVTAIPNEIVIIGGGVIGLEFAWAYAAFGAKVAVVELTEQVLPGNDRRVARATQRSLERMGVEFFLGDAVESVAPEKGAMRSTLRSGRVLVSDVVLSAVGRVPDGTGHGFEEAGVQFDRRAVKVDQHLRTSVPGVYAAGDLIGGMMLAHVADEEGAVAARNAVSELAARTTGEPPRLESVRYDCIPACVYTTPNIATVGMTRDAATGAGVDAVQAISKYTGNAKALAEGEADGFVQVTAERETGRLLGCQVVGPHAVETIHEVALAMRYGITVRQVADTVHAHPTASEAIKAACRDAADKCGR